MRFATAVDGVTAEKVFGSFRNSITKTTTATAATIARGAPVILATATASCNGYDIQRAVSSTAVEINNLFIGLAADFPDTTTGQTGTWGAEDVGQVQVYGFHSAAVVRGFESAITIGTILIPNNGFSGVLETAGVPVTAAATATAGHGLCYGLGGQAFVAEQLASAATNTASQTCKIFIRCM